MSTYTVHTLPFFAYFTFNVIPARLSHVLIWRDVAPSCRSAGASGPLNNELGNDANILHDIINEALPLLFRPKDDPSCVADIMAHNEMQAPVSSEIGDHALCLAMGVCFFFFTIISI